MRRRLRSGLTSLAALAAFAAFASMQACAGLDDALSPGRKPDAAPARVGLSARLPAFAKGTVTALSLKVQASYLRDDDSKVALATLTVTLDDVPTQQVPLAIDLGPCLADPRRKGAGTNAGCVVSLDVVLMDGARTIDQQTVGPLPLTAGEQRTLPDAVQLFEVASVKVGTGTVGAGNGTDPTRLLVGGTLALDATVTSTTGQAAERVVQWSSDAPAIARVDASTGLVTAVAPGTARITAAVVGVPGATGGLTVTVVPPTSPITVTAGGVGGGTVRSSPAGIDCRMSGGQTFGVCTASFAGTAQVVLTATPDPDAAFDAWSGACAGSAIGAQCAIDASQARLAVATFSSTQRHLTIGAAGTGAGTVKGTGIDCRLSAGGTTGTCDAGFALGTSVTLVATPTAGHRFAGWSGACAAAATPTCTVVLGTDAVATARFDGPPTLTLSVAGAGGGRVTLAGGATGSCAHVGGATPNACPYPTTIGASVTLAAQADPTATFAGWTGACGGTSSTCTVTMDAAKAVTATFARRQITITVALGGPGAGSLDVGGTPCTLPAGAQNASCQVLIDAGTTVTLRPSPAAGSAFDQWLGACAGAPASACAITPNADLTVGADFKPLRVGLTIASPSGATGDGKVTSTPAGVDCSLTKGVAIPECTTTAPYHDVLTLRATPAVSSTFGGWGGACASSGTNPTCTIVPDVATNVQARFTIIRNALDVTLSGTGTGAVTSSVAGIACPGACTATYDYGTVVTLTATAGASSTFGGWGGSCSAAGLAPTCTVSMSAARSATATFSLVMQALTVNAAGGGSGTVSSSPAGVSCPGTCATTFVVGTAVTLTAAPASGSFFSGWSGACTGASTTCTVTMDAAKSVTATFGVVTYPLAVSLSGTGTGAVTSAPTGIDCPSAACSATYASGSVVTLTATPASGSLFSGWTGACSGSASTCTVTVSAARTVGAVFDIGVAGITAAVGGTGSGAVRSSPSALDCPPACTTQLPIGTSVVLTATAAAGSYFARWDGCPGTGTEPERCVVSLTSDQRVTATFTRIDGPSSGPTSDGGGTSSAPPAAPPAPPQAPPGSPSGAPVSVTLAGLGKGLVVARVGGVPTGISCPSTCTATYPVGTRLSLKVTPDAASTFVGWSGACTGTGECEFRIAATDGPRAIVATFAVR